MALVQAKPEEAAVEHGDAARVVCDPHGMERERDYTNDADVVELDELAFEALRDESGRAAARLHGHGRRVNVRGTG